MNRSCLVRFSAFAVVLAASALGLAQAIKPSLKIESPADGTVVNPGQTITVSVSSPSGVVLKLLDVFAEYPLQISAFAESAPAQFSLTIPSDIPACRRYTLVAEGVTPAGDSVKSEIIFLDVERADTPISLETAFNPLNLELKGTRYSMWLTATFADGSVFHVNESSNVTYESSNIAVVTVDRFGKPTAVAPGTATIRITYKNPKGGSLQLSLPVTVLPPQEN